MIFTTVLFSSFSKIKNQKEKIGDVYLRVTNGIIFLITPFLIILLFYTHEIVLTVFGNDWIGIVDLIQIFILLIVFHTITLLRSNINLAQGNSDYEFYFNIVGTVLDVSAVILGIFYGLEVVAINLVFAAILKGIIAVFFISKSLQIPISFFLKNLSIPIITFSIITGIMFIIKKSFDKFSINDILELTIFSFITLILSIIVMYLSDKKTFIFLFNNIKSSFQKEKSNV
jgi:PST family polysaccharide transporter